MSTSLNVLIVEDCPTDVRLMERELHRANFETYVTCVMTEQDFTGELRSDVDVILADYTLPGFNALRVLELLHESGLEIPLIIVSGSVGEDTALAAIHLGAADYILKDRLRRLGPAVRDAMEKHCLRREKRAFEEQLAARENSSQP